MLIHNIIEALASRYIWQRIFKYSLVFSLRLILGNWLPTSGSKKRRKTAENDAKMPIMTQHQRKNDTKICSEILVIVVIGEIERERERERVN